MGLHSPNLYTLKFAFSRDSTGTHHVTDSTVAMELFEQEIEQRSRDLQEVAMERLEQRLRHLSDELTWPTRPNMSQWFVDRRNQCRAMVEELFDRDVILGRDDSVLHDGDTVYVVNHQRYGLSQPMHVVDEFFGIACHGYPMAQMLENIYDDPGECITELPSFELVSQAGCFVNAVICIQQLFRTRRSFRTLVGAQLLPIRLRHMAVQHTVAQFLDLRPPKTAVECSVLCGTCDLAWFEEGWICPVMCKRLWPLWFAIVVGSCGPVDIAGVSQAASLG